MEGNLLLKIDWASLIVTSPPGGGGVLYLEGRFKGRFFALRVWGAYIWRAYTWRGLFS